MARFYNFMRFKNIKDTKEFAWTRHAVLKMKFYGLTQNRVKKIFRAPDRIEEGIVAGTIAIMQIVGNKRKTEIWLMCQKSKNGQIKIISVWRYPGISPARYVPIPDEILSELKLNKIF